MLLETNYRERLNHANHEVKRRLDYQLALQHLKVRMEKEHMVNWVEKNVVGSITAQQVGVKLSNCRSLQQEEDDDENVLLFTNIFFKSPLHLFSGRFKYSVFIFHYLSTFLRIKHLVSGRYL